MRFVRSPLKFEKYYGSSNECRVNGKTKEAITHTLGQKWPKHGIPHKCPTDQQ
jgi:hypothetical protein